MHIQSQILTIKAFLRPKSGFLIIEVLVAIFLCLVFVLVMLKFESEILSMYERFFVRNIALNLAVNAFDSGGKNENASGLGHEMKLTKQTYDQDSKVVVSWRNCVGRDEKLVLDSA